MPEAPTETPPDTSSTQPQEPEKKGRFEPKQPVKLDPPKSDPITLDYLRECNGTDPSLPTLLAIKTRVYDVSGNKAYAPDGGYRVFAGHDCSRALAKTSLKPEDVRGEWRDLPESERKVLDDWETFFAKRYNVVGLLQVQGEGKGEEEKS